ncbi:MAG TPA: hypothetical protein VHY32_02575 [Caulobacteraceae bacterium]|jgi:hypothetical protein|nr:hypothetical protein [Caulobacteraceae bacterium]
MKVLKSTLLKGVLVGAVAAGALATASVPALADVACNRFGECWRVHDHYTNYPTDLGVVFHDDAWWDHNKHRHHWRADRPDDHGYYSHGAWHPF